MISSNGDVHLMRALQGEHTLCGIAFDIGSEDGEEDLETTSSRTVTCESCILEIMNCRGVRVK